MLFHIFENLVAFPRIFLFNPLSKMDEIQDGIHLYYIVHGRSYLFKISQRCNNVNLMDTVNVYFP